LFDFNAVNLSVMGDSPCTINIMIKLLPVEKWTNSLVKYWTSHRKLLFWGGL